MVKDLSIIFQNIETELRNILFRWKVAAILKNDLILLILTFQHDDMIIYCYVLHVMYDFLIVPIECLCLLHQKLSRVVESTPSPGIFETQKARV